jgi:hypothetical protein
MDYSGFQVSCHNILSYSPTKVYLLKYFRYLSKNIEKFADLVRECILHPHTADTSKTVTSTQVLCVRPFLNKELGHVSLFLNH